MYHVCMWQQALISGDVMCSISKAAIYGKRCASGTELHPDLQQVLDYCTTFAPRLRSAASEEACRRAVQAHIKHPYYVGLVLNLSPESASELIGLIPQLAVRLLALLGRITLSCAPCT
jgi:hypothetical protein